MPSDAPEKKGEGEAFDVVLVHGPTVDGHGTRVLRARPGQLEAGEVRPLRQGQPLAPGGEVVRLVERADSANIYDVKVDYKAPSTPAKSAGGGPPQVASAEYRASWERTFTRRQPAHAKPN